MTLADISPSAVVFLYDDVSTPQRSSFYATAFLLTDGFVPRAVFIVLTVLTASHREVHVVSFRPSRVFRSPISDEFYDDISFPSFVYTFLRRPYFLLTEPRVLDPHTARHKPTVS